MAVDESQGFREHTSGCLNYSAKLGSVLADVWASQEWALPPIPGFSHTNRVNGMEQRGEPKAAVPMGDPHAAIPEAGEGAGGRMSWAGAPKHVVPGRRAGVSRALPGQPGPRGHRAAGEARRRWLLLHGVGRSWRFFACCCVFCSQLCLPDLQPRHAVAALMAGGR